MGQGAPPAWVERLAYAEKFHVEPHAVNPPLLWWHRWQEWEYAKAMRRAREAQERHGLDKLSPEARQLFDDLVLRYGK